MSAKKPKLWISNKHTSHISHRALDSFEERNRSLFDLSRRVHASWQEAHASVLSDRRADVKKAEDALKKAKSALVRAALMRAPEVKP